jgi:hypothetical protein
MDESLDSLGVLGGWYMHIHGWELYNNLIWTPATDAYAFATTCLLYRLWVFTSFGFRALSLIYIIWRCTSN